MPMVPTRTTTATSAAFAHPNGAVVPVDEPAVQAAKADHFAAKATAYAAAPLAVAPLAVAPAAHIIHKRQAALALGGAALLGYGLAGSYGRKYGRRYGKREAEPGYGYRSYGYGRRYGGYRSYGYGKREAEPGYGYRSYGYGRRYGGYRSYGYGKRSAEADAALLY